MIIMYTLNFEASKVSHEHLMLLVDKYCAPFVLDELQHYQFL